MQGNVNHEKLLVAQLDVDLINEKRKDPQEFKKFIDRGRALSVLVDKLMAVNHSQICQK